MHATRTKQHALGVPQNKLMIILLILFFVIAAAMPMNGRAGMLNYKEDTVWRQRIGSYIKDVFLPKDERMATLAHKLIYDEPLNDTDKYLLKNHVNDVFAESESFMGFAMNWQNIKMVDVLFSNGSTPYDQKFMRKILEYDDHEFSTECLKLYVKYGGDVNYIRKGESLLVWFAVFDDFESFQILLRAGANPWIEGQRFGNAFSAQANKSKFQILEYALDNNLLKDGPMEGIRKIMGALASYEQRNNELSATIRNLARRVIRETDYEPDQYTAAIFKLEKQ